MADISKVRMLNGTEYNYKDAKARSDIEGLKADLEDLDERVDALESGGGGSGLTADVKEALLTCFRHVVFTDSEEDYYANLEEALYPPADLVSISAVYTQSGTVYDTDSLDSLKSDLVVTAHYSDSTTGIVTGYTLSGTLAEGTSTITVVYGGKTTTFTVTVSAYVDPRTLIYNWDFTESLTDTVAGATATINENAVQSSSGLTINNDGCAVLCKVYNSGLLKNRDYEFDIASMSKDFGNVHGRFICFGPNNASSTGSNGFIYRDSGYWQFYKGSWSGENTVSSATAFIGKTLRMNVDNDGVIRMYEGDTLIATCPEAPGNTMAYLRLGDSSQPYYTFTVTAVRVYSIATD